MKTLLSFVKIYFDKNVNMFEFWFLAIWISLILAILSSDYGKTEVVEHTTTIKSMVEIIVVFVIMPAIVGFNMRKK
jgi:hypothetical protein